MVNNKGFTLIELLAVIVILSLLFGIGFTAISKYINEARNTTYETYEKNMEDATKNMMRDCLKNDTEGCIPSNGKSKKVTLGDLETFKYSEKLKDPESEGKFCDPNGSFVIVTNSNGNTTDLTYQVCLICSNYRSKACSEINVEDTDCPAENDTEGPSCGVTTGTSTVWTNKDRVVTVACSDDCIGCEKDSYSVRYSTTTKTSNLKIKDKTGKENDCPINVYVDKNEPTCELEVTGSKNETTGWYGGSAPVVKWKSKADVDSGISTYGLGLAKTEYNFGKEEEYIVSPGITTVYGYVKDKAGNVGTCSIEVKYDSDKPVIKSVDYGYQVYPKDDIATKSGSTITLNSKTSEYGNILGAYIYFKSGTGGKVTIKNGSTELSSISVSSRIKKMRFKFNPVGSYNNITITLANDTQLNDVDRIELLTDHTNGFYTNQNVTVYINGSDSISGKSEYSFDNGSTWSVDNSKVYGTNQSNISLKMRDGAKNVSGLETRTINNIDKLPPLCELKRSSAANGYGWYKTDVKVQFKSTSDQAKTNDYANSGVSDYSFNASGVGNPKEQTQSTDTPVAGKTHTGYVVDKAGNIGTCSTVIKLDKIAPECKSSVSYDTRDTNGIDIKVTCDAKGGSPCASVSQTGTHYNKTSNQSYKVYDLAGNSDTCGATVSTYKKYRRKTQSCSYDACYYGENTCEGGMVNQGYYYCNEGTLSSNSCKVTFRALMCNGDTACVSEQCTKKCGNGCSYAEPGIEYICWVDASYEDTSYYDPCKTGHNTCSGAYYSHGDWSGWSGYDFDSCSTNSCNSNSARVAACEIGTFYSGSAN